LSIERIIIIKSIQLMLVLTVVNIIFSFIMSKAYFESIETNTIKEIMGNTLLLESMLLFIYGVICAYSNTPRLRGDNKDENIVVNVRGRSVMTVPTKRRMVVVDDSEPSKQVRPFVSILCGVMLLAEMVALAIWIV